MKIVLSVATVAVRTLLSYHALLITLTSVVKPDGVNLRLSPRKKARKKREDVIRARAE